tara:strand:+ start:14595 stop:15203 length:609 start_codon:yes stop_codon:yes gene_type:complete
MNARNAFILFVTLISATACSTVNTAVNGYGNNSLRPYASWTGLISQQKTRRDSNWAIDVNSRIYVAQPVSGYQDELLVGEIVNVFYRYYPHVRQGTHLESLEQALVSARYAGMDFVVYPHVHTYLEQDGIDKVLKEEVLPGEFNLGEARMDIYIYASQGEALVDHLKLDTRGSIFTTNSRKLIWPPLDAYLKSLSQFNLVRR